MTEAFIIKIIRSFLTACSFLTILPVPAVEWKNTDPAGNNECPLCVMLPVVGTLLGMFWTFFTVFLPRWESASAVLRGALMTLAVLALTGGLHMDGFMDTCDAIFSRRDRDTRLKILSDPHSGSFAVMGCAAVIILRTALFAEILSVQASRRLLCAVVFVPVWSRLGMGVMLNDMPFARDCGLARMFGQSRARRHTFCLCIAALCLGAFCYWLGVPELPAIWAVVFFMWRRCCLSVFGGITGDLLGAFAEISETALLFALRGV